MSFAPQHRKGKAFAWTFFVPSDIFLTVKSEKPPKGGISIPNQPEHDILQVEGINSKGYGIIPKLVMQDKRLSIYAKAIYAYFCSYAGAGQQAFPRVSKIVSDLGISRNAYYKYFGQLKEHGYIQAEQKHRNGRLSHNIYTLLSEIQIHEGCCKKQCTTRQYTVSQDTVRRDTSNSNRTEKEQKGKSNSSFSSPPNPLDEQQDESLAVEMAAGAGTPAHHSRTPAGFEAFWAAYPRKQAKGAAERAWRKLAPGMELQASILEAVKAAKKSSQWKRDNGRYVPAPAKWLNNQGWLDELSPARSASYNLEDVMDYIHQQNFFDN